MGQEPIIEYQNINKVYGENVAVEDINLKIYPGDFVCFIGTSGSGENSIIVTDTIIKLNQGLKASTKFLNKMILI
ncbi:TPA: hypothetical protein ACG6RK_001308 [Streptococcus agalactiae]